MKAVQFGAGNIGRGFTAQLFTESGYEVVFVEVVTEVVDLLNARRSYPIRFACEDPWQITISNVRAVNGRDIEAVSDELATAELACTAVGVNVLPAVAPAIARGVEKRAKLGAGPLNIIICENLSHAEEFLQAEVSKHLPPELKPYLLSNVGFVESVVARMVPVMTETEKAEDPLLIVVEPYKHLPVDSNGFIGPIPEIVGVEPRGNFQGYVDRKLFAHNCSHAIAAYLGYQRGYTYIYEAVKDPDIHCVMMAALDETGRALVAKHSMSAEEHQAYVTDLTARFENSALRDQVARVARDPLRKLGPEDRLVGGAKFALEQGIEPINVSIGIAAGLLYDAPDDPSVPEVQRKIRELGLEGAMKEICGIEPGSRLSELVLSQLGTVEDLFRRNGRRGQT